MRKIHLATLFVSLLFTCSCRKSPSPTGISIVSEDPQKKILDVRIESKSIGGVLWYRAVIPTPTGVEKMPVLYFLHGANSDPEEITTISPIADLAAANHIIVIIPNAEYSYYTNAKHRSDARWEDAIADDLRRDVETRFPVLTGGEHTAIAGLSMGGYGAAKIALKYPQQYSFVGVMSGALDITRRPASPTRLAQTYRIWSIFGVRSQIRNDEDVFELLKQSPTETKATWFLTSGENEPLFGVDERFYRELLGRKAHATFTVVKGGDHDWRNWNEMLPILFKKTMETISANSNSRR